MYRLLTAGVLCGLVVLIALASSRRTPEPEPTPPEPPPQKTRREVAKKETPEDPNLIAERGYERLLRNRREGVLRVTWSWAEHEGRRVVRDVTLTRQRTARMMGRVRDVFETATDSDLLRTADGDLLVLETETRLSARTDRSKVRRTATGYAVTRSTGDNSESFEFDTPGPAQVDAETFLGPKIRSGEAKAGMTFTCQLLDTGKRRLVPSELEVVGPDDEGPGLKVVETLDGDKTLWWFASDGAVVRLRSGDVVIRRADHVGLDDLPRRPATNPVTLHSDRDLPRLFTSRRLVVDVEVETDETIQPPRIADNPFTETIRRGASHVRLLLKDHDDPKANTPLPVAAEGMQEYLKATPLMEVDDPVVRRHARTAAAGATDARTAARSVADYVFRMLRKGSPEMPEPTAKEILADPVGDCSEHCLLFTALCRAAGVPARRCSGYVCIGDDWGAHAWCEIWVGKWIGADPTTNEIGTRARYIFLGRQDEPEVRPGVIRARRTHILIRRAEYDDGVIDFEKGKVDSEVFSGIRFGDLPEGWRVERSGRQASLLVKDGGFRVDAVIEPDQGYRALDILLRYHRGSPTTFGGRQAVVRRFSRQSTWTVPLGRQNLKIYAAPQRGTALPIAQIEKAFKPTLDRDDG